jgi:hypothetical protein
VDIYWLSSYCLESQQLPVQVRRRSGGIGIGIIAETIDMSVVIETVMIETVMIDTAMIDTAMIDTAAVITAHKLPGSRVTAMA